MFKKPNRFPRSSYTTPYLKLCESAAYAPTQANYSWLRNFFPCNEATNDTFITDTVGGLVLQNIGGGTVISNPGDGSITWSGGTLDTIIAGALPSPVGKNALLLLFSRTGTIGQCQIGGTSASYEKGIRLSLLNSQTPRAANGAHWAVADDNIPGNNTQRAYALEVNYNAADAGDRLMTLHSYTTLGGYASNTPYDLDAAGHTAPVAYDAVTNFAGTTNPGLIVLGMLDEPMPASLLEDGLTWMHEQVFRQKPDGSFWKCLYPPWAVWA